MSTASRRLLEWCRIATTLIALCLAVVGVGDIWVVTGCAAAIAFTVASFAAELAALHEGEEPHYDDAIVTTPGQWIWRWNHATPARRLGMVRRIQAMRDQNDRVQAVARDWAEAQPLLPGQALADLANALSDNPEPVMCHSVRIGKHYIRVHGDRVPTPDEQAAIGALLNATEVATGGEPR